MSEITIDGIPVNEYGRYGSRTVGNMQISEIESQPLVSQGWQCPICKRILSPVTMYCIFCTGQTIKYNVKGEGTL